MSLTKIAVFGGAFDPPHRGHAAVARHLTGLFDEVWVMPAYKHMYDKRMTPYEDRLEMCNLLFREDSKIIISDFESHYPELDGSYALLTKLTELNPTTDFYFVIGQDNANTVERWKNYERLLNEFAFVVFPRPGYVETKSWYKQAPHLFVENMTSAPPISSTTIRKQLKNKQAADYLSRSVIGYIKNNRLYGC